MDTFIAVNLFYSVCLCLLCEERDSEGIQKGKDFKDFAYYSWNTHCKSGQGPVAPAAVIWEVCCWTSALHQEA